MGLNANLQGRNDMKHRILAAALLGLAACGGEPAGNDANAPVAGSTEAPATPAATPDATETPPATPESATTAPLQVADVDAYVRGMHEEVELLQAEYHKIEQARAAGDRDAETEAMVAMTANGIDEGGAKAAALPLARYRFVRNRIDEIQSKLDMLEGLRKMPGDSSAMQARVGDPYAGFAVDVAAALKAQQPQLAALRAQAMGLRAKAAGG
jgi:hypothetical protein